jgi:hypothetical protein
LAATTPLNGSPLGIQERSMAKTEDERRAAYLTSKHADLTAYAAMIGEEFASRVHRLAKIIGTSHEPSVGAYKESILRGAVSKFIPKRYTVGTGFVVFTKDSERNDATSTNIDLQNLKDHCTSKQLDIVVYDDYNFPPLLREGEFVVLRPESVRSVVEVTGYLTLKKLDEVITSFVDFGRKWREYQRYRSTWGTTQSTDQPSLELFAWDVYVRPDGRPDCDGRTIRQGIVKSYRSSLAPAELSERSVPLLNAAYLYNNCIVSRCGYSRNEVSRDGYLTSRGQFIRYDADRKPSQAGDCTIASLLAAIHVSLETPFNADFSYFDQSMRTDVFRHECAGITDLDSGEEADA